MWDLNPGLIEANNPGFSMCNNFCRADCAFTGSPDGTYTTLHVMLKDITAASTNFEKCDGPGFTVRSGMGSFCRPEAGPGQGVPYPGMK